MKLLIIIFATVTKATAIPLFPEQIFALAQPPLGFTSNRDILGHYNFGYLTDEGTTSQEQGKIVLTPDGNKVLAVEEQVNDIRDDNEVYMTKYRADDDRKKVYGSHFPVAPDSKYNDITYLKKVGTLLPEHRSNLQVKTENNKVFPEIKMFVGKKPEIYKIPAKSSPQLIILGNSKSVINIPKANLPEMPVSLINGPETEVSEGALPQIILPLPQAPTMPSSDGPIHISQIMIPKELMSEVLVADSPRVLSGTWQKINI